MALVTFSKYARQFSHAFVLATIAFAHASRFVLVPYSGIWISPVATLHYAIPNRHCGSRQMPQIPVERPAFLRFCPLIVSSEEI